MPEILSICIPTYERAAYLADLLRSLQAAYVRLDSPADVKIYIADNASADETREVVAAFAATLPIVYQRNPTNIGGARNFAKVIDDSVGEYFWLLGDDETVPEGALAGLLPILRERAHGLILLHSTGNVGLKPNAPTVSRPATFANYTAFVEHFSLSNPWMMMEHSLISYNVVRRSAFSRVAHERVLAGEDFQYAHMYGLVEGLISSGESVFLPDFSGLVIRPVRAHVAVEYLEVRRLWRRYYAWLAEKFSQPGLVRYGRSLYGPSKQFRAARRRLWARLAGWLAPGAAPAKKP